MLRTKLTICGMIVCGCLAAEAVVAQDQPGDAFNFDDTEATPPPGAGEAAPSEGGIFDTQPGGLGEFDPAAAAAEQPIPPETQANFDAGKALYDSEDYQGALLKFSQAASEIGEIPFPELWYYTGLAAQEEENLQTAYVALQNAVAQDEDKEHKEYRVRLAEVLNRIGGPQQALQYANEAIEIDGTDAYADAIHQRGVAYRNLQQEDEALEDLKRAIELDDTQKEFYYDLGIAQVEFEDYDEGIANLTRAIELAGDEPYTQALIARNAAYIRASKLAENRGRARELLENAVSDAKAAIATEESLAVGNFNLGIAYRYLGRYDDAIDVFTEALAENQKAPPSEGTLGLSAEIHLRRGIVWFYLGDYDLALGDFDDGLLSAGTVPEPRLALWRGLTLAKLGRYAEAIGSYTNAVSVSPAYDAAYFNRGLAYLRSGNPEKALDDFNAYVRIRPREADGYLHRALALDLLGDERGATSSFARAKSYDPSVADTEIGRRLADLSR